MSAEKEKATQGEWILCIMLDKMKSASDCYKKGCTCSQAILCAYAEELGMDKETAYRMMEGFGCGMGEMQELCSALAAAVCVVSFHTSGGRIEAGCSSMETHEGVRRIMDIFRREYGGITCREILRGVCPERADCGMKVKDMVIMIDQVMYEMEMKNDSGNEVNRWKNK